MSKSQIIAELAKLSLHDRREIMERILELEDNSEILEERRHLADEAFQILDALEDEDAKDRAG
jgi:hypothetical protein